MLSVDDEQGPVRVGRFQWERLLMMSDLPEQDRFRLLAVGIFMDGRTGAARPGNVALAEFGPHEETWKKLLRRTVKAGWLLLVSRGGARRASGGATVRRASVYAAAVPRDVWKRREEILGNSALRAADAEANHAPLKEAPRDFLQDSMKEASKASFKAEAKPLKEAPRDFVPNPSKEAPTASFESFEGSPQGLPQQVVTTSPSSLPTGGRQASDEETERQQHRARIASAAVFLEDLPAPWTVGPKTAAALAPLLLERATTQGWRPDAALVTKLTERPVGIDNYQAVLRRRIEDLPKQNVPAAAAARVSPPEPRPLPDWCGECDAPEYRWLERDGREYRCPTCHPDVIGATT